jgi:hypothetical protein
MTFFLASELKYNFSPAAAGSIFTVVTSEGGEAITLAASGAGAVTSFAGSEWNVATSALSGGTSNAALGAKASFGMPGFSIATVLGGAVFGAVWTLL